MNQRFVALGALALSLSLGMGLGASAEQGTPTPAATPINLPTLPPEAKLDPYTRTAIDILTQVVRGQLARNANTTRGEVTYFKRFEMQIKTGNNQYRSVHLHQGTVINPRGASIANGQQVDVGGNAQSDGSLDANVITIQQ